MLIPSIDLMGGKVVQLVQGKTKALEFDNADEWMARFSGFPVVQLIDLDAAMGQRNNASLITRIVQRLPCQVGGGIRSIDAARAVLAAGAQRVILGSVLIERGRININAARQFADELGLGKLVFAIDSREGKVAIRGWKELTEITPQQMIETLEPFCGGFLYTHIETEGSMAGIPLAPVRELRQATSKQLIAAGGISTHQEIDLLHSIGVDAVVGMAIYTNLLQLPYTIPASQ
jgi:phosphoribosylformimino-5-aminoimidazole carboxamide ribotide isomerase